MSAWKSLLVATDVSRHAGHAAYRAAVLAAEQHAQLRRLHMSRSSQHEILRSHPGAEAALIDDCTRC
jgi:hypothetical protein